MSALPPRLNFFLACLAVTLVNTRATAPAAETNAPRPSATVTTNVGAVAFTNAFEKPSASGGETNAPPRSDYAAFTIINERNIFNPNRSRRSSRDGGDKSRPVRADTFSLVGTMSYAKGDFAFFDGSSAGYRRALKPTEHIAGYRITEISPNRVKLESDGKTVELAVGDKMRREDEGAWEVIVSPAARETGSAKTGETPSSDDENDVVKKLMQKREAEANK